MKTASLPLPHALLAFAVVAVWGTNFPIIKIALSEIPPLLLAALRFALAFLPAAFFVRRPAVSVRVLAAYGLLIGVGQFSLLYIAMRGQISPGLASLIIQTQAFFTILLAMKIDGERLEPIQWLSLAVAAAGIGVIAWHSDANTTLVGLLLVLLAAACWAGGNIIARHHGRVGMLAITVWSSAFAIPPLFLLAIVFEGPKLVTASLAHASPATWAAVAWQTIGNTLFGYAAWGWLLARHPAAVVSPLALLVPIFGIAASAWWVGEPLPAWKLVATGIVLTGLGINLLWPILKRRRSDPPVPDVLRGA